LNLCNYVKKIILQICTKNFIVFKNIDIDISGLAPLHTATIKKLQSIVLILIQAGADFNLQVSDLINKLLMNSDNRVLFC